jgi:hypothetical protein
MVARSGVVVSVVAGVAVIAIGIRAGEAVHVGFAVAVTEHPSVLPERLNVSK